MDDLLKLDDRLVGDVDVGLDGRDDLRLEKVDSGVVRPLRKRTSRFRTAPKLLQLLVELRDLGVANVRVQDIRGLSGVKGLNVLGLTGRSRLGEPATRVDQLRDPGRPAPRDRGWSRTRGAGQPGSLAR